MKEMSFKEFNDMCDFGEYPKDWMSLDAMSLPDMDLFNQLDEALKPFELELLMADTGSDDYTFKIIRRTL